MATKGYSQQRGGVTTDQGQQQYGSQSLYAPRGMMPPQPLPPAGYAQYPQQPFPPPGPQGGFSGRQAPPRGNYYPGATNQPVPIVNRNPYQSPTGYAPAPPQGPPQFAPPPQMQGYPPAMPPMNPMQMQGHPGLRSALPPVDQQRSKNYLRPKTGKLQAPNGDGEGHAGQIAYQRGILFPAKKIRHELMHLDHSDLSQTKPHPYYPEHITTVRIRTPSQWGPSRLGTPTELRSTMTTIERYKLNPSKSAVSLEYEPYSHSDYLTLMSKYQNMRLPKGLGPTDDERWQKEHAKRHRMREYATKIKEMEQELKERRRTRNNALMTDPKMQQKANAYREDKWRS